MGIAIEVEQETDGRWIADVPSIPGALAYGKNRGEAINNAVALAFRILADRIEHGEEIPAPFAELLEVPA
jgi:predicted RNase H-like HicB family nuclease